jgi:hypothetical protein
VTPIRKGEDWGSPVSGPADFAVTGSDVELAASVAAHPGARVRFRFTDSDLAGAVGLDPNREPTTELPMDALRWDDTLVVNMAVLGTAPDRLGRWSPMHRFRVTVDGVEWFSGRATTVIVANGQFFAGLDLVPRGHPGDGRAEIQVWSLARNERARARARLQSGTHVPHPRIAQRTGRRVVVEAARPVTVTADGRRSQVRSAELEVVPAAYRLLV